MSQEINDNDAVPSVQSSADPHGQAALLLVESLIHTLIENRALSQVAAVELIEVAISARIEIADDFGEPPGHLQRSLNLLTQISESLKINS